MPEGTAVLKPLTVGKIQGHFFVPAYQRGYRWGTPEVERLLDDIATSEGTSYYLQPIVVKARDDGSWELIDGQQRLTTLYLILRYIQQEILPSATPKFWLEYETRAESSTYLEKLDAESSQSNIDYFHMFEAHRTIVTWFQNRADDRIQAGLDFFTALSKRVKVIWYEASSDIDAPGLFTRLNVGRIPLTDAELVKALVLSRIRTMYADRVHEVAAQWDMIERDLRAPEVWAFISGKSDQEASHIGLLLDVLAGTRSSRETPLYHTFEALRTRIEHDPQSFWNDVVELHSRILGWYEDREIYHRIGYLVNRGMKLPAMLRMSVSQTKSAFKDALLNTIRETLNLTPSALQDLTYRSAKTQEALLLMNVETVLRNTHSAERYSFQAHASGTWSLEHIHAQQAETLNTEEQWREWLRLHLKGLEAIPEVKQSTVDAIQERLPSTRRAMTRRAFEELEQLVLKAFTDAGQDATGDIDAIDNLALLTGGDNSALSNSMFEVKRQAIINRDREGAFVPICTRNVFLKYYTNAVGQQNHFWGADDRRDYLAAMVDVLQPYLSEEATDD